MEKRPFVISLSIIILLAYLSSFITPHSTGMVTGFQRREAFGIADDPIIRGQKQPKTFPSFSIIDRNLVSHICNEGVLNPRIRYDVTTIRWIYYNLWWKSASPPEQKNALTMIGVPPTILSRYTPQKAFDTWFRYAWVNAYENLLHTIPTLPELSTFCSGFVVSPSVK